MLMHARIRGFEMTIYNVHVDEATGDEEEDEEEEDEDNDSYSYEDDNNFSFSFIMSSFFQYCVYRTNKDFGFWYIF